MPTPQDEARRRAIAEDPLLAPTLRARTAEVDKKLNTLRLQALFLFAFLIASLVLITLYLRAQDEQIRIDRYLACTIRAADITAWNVQLTAAGVPPQPVPKCPADPR